MKRKKSVQISEITDKIIHPSLGCSLATCMRLIFLSCFLLGDKLAICGEWLVSTYIEIDISCIDFFNPNLLPSTFYFTHQHFISADPPPPKKNLWPMVDILPDIIKTSPNTLQCKQRSEKEVTSDQRGHKSLVVILGNLPKNTLGKHIES